MHSGSCVKQWRTHANIQQSGGPTARACACPIRKAGASLHADVAGGVTRASTQTTVGASSIVQKPAGWTLAVTSLGSRDPPTLPETLPRMLAARHAEANVCLKQQHS